MSFFSGNFAHQFRLSLRTALLGPQVLAFLPALTLIGYWWGGERAMLYMALLLPVLFAVSGLFSGSGSLLDARDGATKLRLRKAAVHALDQYLSVEKETGRATAALVINIDDFHQVEENYGARAASSILLQIAERLQYALRDNDILVRLNGDRFGVALTPMRRVDLETLIQLAARLQSAAAEPYSVDATRIYITISVGFCTTARLNARSGEMMLQSAESAVTAAAAQGAGSIRAYSPEIKRRALALKVIHDGAASALERGEIVPWFQPQISTDTGRITGFTAIARWEHPEQGAILPADFMSTLINLGASNRLWEIMLNQSLLALQEWNRGNEMVGTVSIQFSHDNLSDPKITEKLQWELDRYEQDASGLRIEIIEEIIAESNNDVVVKNIAALAAMGCLIDVSDFGTGHASIAKLRQFSIDRVKIDRSFIARVDRDRDQQNMVAAVLTMSEQMGLSTLADGAETVGEHAMLAQLGCQNVQGLSVAKPMPFAQTIDWIKAHGSKLPNAVQLGRKAG